MDKMHIYNLTVKHAKYYSNLYKINFELDTAHDAYVKIIEKYNQYDPSKATLSTWIGKVVDNQYKEIFARNSFKIGETKYQNRISRDVQIEPNSSYDKEDGNYYVHAYSDPDEFELYDPTVLTESDMEYALRTFTVDSIGNKTTERGKREQLLHLKLFKRWIEGEEYGKYVAEEFGINENTYKSFIFRYKAFFIRHIKQLYPNKKIPKTRNERKKLNQTA